MADRIIENPILNSPFGEPDRHFRFDDDGITNEIVEGRRPSAYFVPIPRREEEAASSSSSTREWTAGPHRGERRSSTSIREPGRPSGGKRGYPGRHAGHPRRCSSTGPTPTGRTGSSSARSRPLETAIYLDRGRAEGRRRLDRERAPTRPTTHRNPGLPRVALKMATGSGKTVVMAMLIAWQTLNKVANPQDARFSDTFLVVTPGITIRDRLRVLLPERRRATTTGSATSSRPTCTASSARRKIVITNFHAFQLRETKRIEASRKLTKEMLAGTASPSPFTRDAGPDGRAGSAASSAATQNIVVLNDEAHHCYRAQARASADEKLTGDERSEAEERDEEARVWISGLRGGRATRSASRRSTTSRPRRSSSAGSGYPEGTLFPWVVSDFSLIDAIESGIVKVPRVPVADDAMTGDGRPTATSGCGIRDELPEEGPQGRRRRRPDRACPAELEGALHSLYGNYEKRVPRTGQSRRAAARRARRRSSSSSATTPTSRKLVFDWIAGWERDPAPTARPSACPASSPLFTQRRGRRAGRTGRARSSSTREQLESGEAMSADFKKIAAAEIDEFKAEYRAALPGPRRRRRSTDEDLLREVMNTVGKPGKLGEQVRCVVSRLDAHRGLGRQHRHPHPRRPRLRHAAPVRAGRRPRPAPPLATPSNDDGLFDARVRRGLRRPVPVHPHRRQGRQPDYQADPLRPCPAREEGSRDQFSAGGGLPTRDPRSGAVRGIHRTVPADSGHERHPHADLGERPHRRV